MRVARQYLRHVGGHLAGGSSSLQSAPVTAPAPANAAQVWVNTKSGIYHYPGTRWYGTTKQGEYMSEAQAQANGYRAARNGQ